MSLLIHEHTDARTKISWPTLVYKVTYWNVKLAVSPTLELVDRKTVKELKAFGLTCSKGSLQAEGVLFRWLKDRASVSQEKCGLVFAFFINACVSISRCFLPKICIF